MTGKYLALCAAAVISAAPAFASACVPTSSVADAQAKANATFQSVQAVYDAKVQAAKDLRAKQIEAADMQLATAMKSLPSSQDKSGQVLNAAQYAHIEAVKGADQQYNATVLAGYEEAKAGDNAAVAEYNKSVCYHP